MIMEEVGPMLIWKSAIHRWTRVALSMGLAVLASGTASAQLQLISQDREVGYWLGTGRIAYSPPVGFGACNDQYNFYDPWFLEDADENSYVLTADSDDSQSPGAWAAGVSDPQIPESWASHDSLIGNRNIRGAGRHHGGGSAVFQFWDYEFVPEIQASLPSSCSEDYLGSQSESRLTVVFMVHQPISVHLTADLESIGYDFNYPSTTRLRLSHDVSGSLIDESLVAPMFDPYYEPELQQHLDEWHVLEPGTWTLEVTSNAESFATSFPWGSDAGNEHGGSFDFLLETATEVPSMGPLTALVLVFGIAITGLGASKARFSRDAAA
jgi:hypothetical protein